MKRLLPALLSGLFLLTFFSELTAQTPRTRAYLWTRYETGDKPTQTDYRDVFASFFSKVEDSLYISQLRGVDTLLTDATLTGATDRQIPTAAAVKTYVDNAISGGVGAVTSVFGRTGGITAGAGDYTASQITNTPAGDIAATTVQAAINELDSEKLQDTTGSVDADNIATGAVGADELASSGVTLGTYGSDTQIPVITIDADGRITSASNVAAAGGGGGVADGDKTDIDVSSSGTVWTIDTSAVTTVKIANDAVTGAKIAASTIDSTDIATGGIGNTDLQDAIVTAGKIATGAVNYSALSAAAKDSLGRVESVVALNDSTIVVTYVDGAEDTLDVGGGVGGVGGIDYVTQDTAPTDTTKLWLDNSRTLEWPLMQRVRNGWRTIGWYVPLANHFSQKKPIWELTTGQSNAENRTGASNNPADARIIENTSGTTWAISDYSTTNNIGRQFAYNVVTKEDRVVFHKTIALASRPIEDWYPDSTKYNEIVAWISANSIDSVDVVCFRQGEANSADTEAQYAAKMKIVLDGLMALPQFKNTTFLMGNMNESYIGTGPYDYYNSLNQAPSGGINIVGVNMLGLSQAGGIHIDGASIDTVGARYYEAYRGQARLYALEKTPYIDYDSPNELNIQAYSSINPVLRLTESGQGRRGGFLKYNDATNQLVLGGNSVINGLRTDDIASISVDLAGKIGIGDRNQTLTTNTSLFHIRNRISTIPIAFSLGNWTDNALFQIDTLGRLKKPLVLFDAESTMGAIWLKHTSSSVFEAGRIRFSKAGDNFIGSYIHNDGSGNLFHIGTHPTSDMTVGNDVNVITIPRAGTAVGILNTSPTAKIHIGAGTATASTAPLKFTSGTNLTTPEAGAMEWDGTNLYVTQTTGPTRKTIAYSSDLSAYLPLAGGTLTGNLLFTDNTYDIGASGATRPRTGYFGTSVVSPLVSSSTNLALTGTNNVSIASGNLTTVTATDSLTLVGGNTRLALEDDKGLDVFTNDTRRMTIPSSGIANTPSSTKALVLSSTDSLGYTTLQSSDWSNTVTQSGSDTLLNAAAGYGHFQRIGNVVSFTLRVEIALTSAGDANTVYIDPPIASDFTTAASDVIGTATMDPQTLSGANTQRQRCLVFASDSDDKIGVSFDPVASLTYPENRMYISVSGSYVIQ